MPSAPLTKRVSPLSPANLASKIFSRQALHVVLYLIALVLILAISFYVPSFLIEGRFFVSPPAQSFSAFLVFLEGLFRNDWGLSWSHYPQEVLSQIQNVLPGLVFGFLVPFLGAAWLGLRLGFVQSRFLGFLTLVIVPIPLFLWTSIDFWAGTTFWYFLPETGLALATVAIASSRNNHSYRLEKIKPYVHFAQMQGMSERQAFAYAKVEAKKSLLVFWRRGLPLLVLSYVAAQAAVGKGLGALLRSAALERDLPVLRGALLVLLFALFVSAVTCDVLCLSRNLRKQRAGNKALHHKTPAFVSSMVMLAIGIASLVVEKSQGNSEGLWLFGLSLLLGMGLAFVARAASRWPSAVIFMLTLLSALSVLGLAPFSCAPWALALLVLAFGFLQKALYASIRS
jgi:ABC-type dipeptide/oligopeptide/nickel transport system permease component